MEPTHYKTASDISCNNMLCLAKKHQDYNRNIFLNRMISTNCGRGDSEGYFVIGEWINPKHCHNKRPDYNLDWWDKKILFVLEKNLIKIQMQNLIINKIKISVQHQISLKLI